MGVTVYHCITVPCKMCRDPIIVSLWAVCVTSVKVLPSDDKGDNSCVWEFAYCLTRYVRVFVQELILSARLYYMQ